MSAFADAQHTIATDNTNPFSFVLDTESNVPSSGAHATFLWEFQLEYKVSGRLREIYWETLEEIQNETGEMDHSKAVSILANAFGGAMVDLGLTSYGTFVCQEVSKVLNDHLDTLIQSEAWWNDFVDKDTM